MSNYSRLAAIPAAFIAMQVVAAPAWDAATTYTGGEVVSYAGKDWKAQWWSKGNVPNAEQWGPWALQSGGAPTPTVSTTSPMPVTTAAFIAMQAVAAPAWDAATTYTGGEVVSYAGKDWKAQWWSKGNVPNAEQWGPWALQSGGAPTPTVPTTSPMPVTTSSTPTPSACYVMWTASTAYSGGQSVTYKGRNYKAQWWTQGDDPTTNVGAGKSWLDLGDCAGPAGNTNVNVNVNANLKVNTNTNVNVNVNANVNVNVNVNVNANANVNVNVNVNVNANANLKVNVNANTNTNRL